jgi:hypothetical protein
LRAAGFERVAFMRHDAPESGILHKNPWSLPLVAHKPRTQVG